jgi:hypothetical protein
VSHELEFALACECSEAVTDRKSIAFFITSLEPKVIFHPVFMAEKLGSV